MPRLSDGLENLENSVKECILYRNSPDFSES